MNNEIIKKPKISTEGVNTKFVDLLFKEVKELKEKIKEEKQHNSNIIIGVLIAFVFIVVTVAIEVILFHTNTKAYHANLKNQDFQKILEVKKDFMQIEKKSQEINNPEADKNNSESI